MKTEKEQKTIDYEPKLLAVPTYRDAIINLLASVDKKSGYTESECLDKMTAVEMFYSTESVDEFYPVGRWVEDSIQPEIRDTLIAWIEDFTDEEDAHDDWTDCMIEPQPDADIGNLVETLRCSLRASIDRYDLEKVKKGWRLYVRIVDNCLDDDDEEQESAAEREVDLLSGGSDFEDTGDVEVARKSIQLVYCAKKLPKKDGWKQLN